MLNRIYGALPNFILPYFRDAYYTLPGKTKPEIKNERRKQKFVELFFYSREEYESYIEEFNTGNAGKIRTRAEEKYFDLFDYSFGAVRFEIGANYYALVRSLKPERIIETGVCNGFSTLAILLALNKNEHGTLVSIDYPRRADESLQDHILGQHGQDSFDDPRIWKAPRIPPDEDPGWIIPDELRVRWTLRIGMSQRELPIELNENGEMDMFFHDSEHTTTCMLFEYDLAREWLREGGMIISDDIHLNDAFDIFTKERGGQVGKISDDIGYFRETR